MAKKKTSEQIASQRRAKAILTTGLSSALSGLLDSELKRDVIREQGKFQESQTLLGAKTAKGQAEDVIQLGEEEVRFTRRDVKTLIGAQRAATAATGIEIGTGTAGALEVETEILGDLDAITIRNNAFRQAFGFKIQALQAETQARLDRAGRKFKERQQRVSGVQNLLGSTIGAFSSFNQAGGA